MSDGERGEAENETDISSIKRREKDRGEGRGREGKGGPRCR